MEKIYTAKTEEAAKEQAVNEFRALGIDENSITFELVEQPVKKLFGMKGDFRVKASAPTAENIEIPEAPEAPAADEEAPAAEKPKRGRAKKSSVVVAADDDFEEFSIDEIDAD